jgi:hypothetical protein
VFHIPWWGLILLLAVFALAGAAGAAFLTARHHREDRRWYAERKTAYVSLLAVFERDTYRLRAAYETGDKPAPALDYASEAGPALMQMRLLASGSVRSAALAVHVLLQKLHGEMNPAGIPGVQPQTHFRELLAQVPLVMQQFEAAIREELGIDPVPPAPLNGHRGRLAWRPARQRALDELSDIGQDRKGD